MKNVSFLIATGLLLLAIGCSKDSQTPVSQERDKYDAQYYENLADVLLAEDAAEVEFRGVTITVPAGSHNALQAAVDAAGHNGVVVLESGLHTEDNTVVIGHKVKISGQAGAILEVDSDPDLSRPFTLDPAIHVLDAGQVVIEGLTIRDADDGGSVAFLLQNADNARIRNNTVEDFQFGLVPYGADNLRFHDNSFEGIGNGYGILFLTGHNAKIYDNSLVNYDAQIFLGSKGGLVKDNYFSTGFMGLLVCTPWVGDAVVLPNGEVVGTDEPSNEWLVLHNNAENTLWGYLVIDGSHNNTLVNNDAGNNALLDFEMCSETPRFGFIAPTTYENLVISNSYPDVTIKVCGVDNEAVGGIQVDTSEFPCD